jgi:hypothetical protein
MEKEFDRNARPDHIPVKNAFAISIGAQIENGHHSTLRRPWPLSFCVNFT